MRSLHSLKGTLLYSSRLFIQSSSSCLALRPCRLSWKGTTRFPTKTGSVPSQALRPKRPQVRIRTARTEVRDLRLTKPQVPLQMSRRSTVSSPLAPFLSWSRTARPS
eukprot:6040332-Amphidinium_carterae.1